MISAFTMRFIFILIILIPLASKGLCQNNEPPLDTIRIYQPGEMDKPAGFIGGDAMLNKFVRKNVVYPKEALKEKAKGLVVIGLVIDAMGNISNLQVLNYNGGGAVKISSWKDFQEEAIRVVWLSKGKWIPAEKDGRKVKSQFLLPIRFGRP